MKVKIEIGKDEAVKMFEAEPEFEVAIQKAALNYLRNHKLKPIALTEINKEIEKFKQCDLTLLIQSEIRSFLSKNYTSEGILHCGSLDTHFKNSIFETVRDSVVKLIEKFKNEELDSLTISLANWKVRREAELKKYAEDFITPDLMKSIVHDIIDQRFKNK